MANEPAADEDVERAAAEVVAHGERRGLGALCFEVLSRQAEGRVLFAGREFVEARAREHAVDRARAGTSVGNLLDVLERGPGTARERALVAAFGVAGLGAVLGATREPEPILVRFARHADWLETASPYVVYPFVDRLLDAPVAAALWSTLAERTLAESREGDVSTASRARQAARLAILAASVAGQRELARVAAEAEDPVVRGVAEAFARGAAGGVSTSAQAGPPMLRGRVARARGGPFREALRWLSGWALASWGLRGLLVLAGHRREGSLELVEQGVRVRRSTQLFGRVVRESDEVWAWAALAGVRQETRHAGLALALGAAGLAAGIVVGGLLGFDGLRAGEPSLLAIAALVVLAGTGLDLVLDLFFARRSGRVACELRTLVRGAVRLEGVEALAVDRFFGAVERRLARNG
jgi:hypothetical protein